MAAPGSLPGAGRRRGEAPDPAERPPTAPSVGSGGSDAVERFRRLDRYRVDREWRRYEGTAQRELFVELRRRFLRRHARSGGWVVDLGSGPGRFTDDLGPSTSPRLLVDLSEEALRSAARRPRALRRSRGPWSFVRGDARTPPFRRAAFGTVALLGNLVGFAGADAERLLEASAGLVRPGGTLLVEAVAGPGERSRYLRRLPPGEVRRVLRAPARWLDRRIREEGFEQLAYRRSEDRGEFRRLPAEELARTLARHGLAPVERIAVAPLLGTEGERAEAARGDPASWEGLLAAEERAGASPEHLAVAAAYLMAAERPAGDPRAPATGPGRPPASDAEKRGLKYRRPP